MPDLEPGYNPIRVHGPEEAVWAVSNQVATPSFETPLRGSQDEADYY